MGKTVTKFVVKHVETELYDVLGSFPLVKSLELKDFPRCTAMANLKPKVFVMANLEHLKIDSFRWIMILTYCNCIRS